MIGEGYFQLRAQTGSSLYSLTALAQGLGAPEAVLASLQTLKAGLHDPLTVVALGEHGAGKSALLAALFDRDFAGGLELSGRTATHRYAVEPRDEVNFDGTLEVFRPHSFLRDFTVVEVAGFWPSETLTRLLPTADLVLVVIWAGGDPYAACDDLAALDRELLRRCVFIIQRRDAVPDQDLALAVERLRDAMHTRLGRSYPLFAVSALTRVGLNKLDRHLDDEFIISPAKCQKLRDVCAAALTILDEIGGPPLAAMRAAQERVRQLEEERLILVARRDQSLRKATDALWSLTRLFDAAHGRGAQMLRRKLTVVAIHTDPPDWWAEFYEEVESRLREAITRNLSTAFEKFEADLRDAWRKHCEFLRPSRLESPPPFGHDSAVLFARLAAELDAGDHAGATTESIQRACTAARLTLRVPSLAAATAGVLLFAAIAAAGFFTTAAVLAILTASALLIVLTIQRRRVLGKLRQLVTVRREQVLAGFEDEVRAEIDRFYQRLGSNLHALEQVAATELRAIEETVARIHELEESFDRCAGDITARRASLSAEAGGP